MTISQQTFSTPAIVTGIATYARWEGGKDTGEVAGTKVDVLFPDGFERVRISVKIPVLKLPVTQEQIDVSKAKNVPILVMFEGLEFNPYVDKHGPSPVQALSARASALKVVADKPAVGGFGAVKQ